MGTKLWIVSAIALLLFRSAAVQASQTCLTLVTSAQDAADKADWIIEGNIVGTFRSTAPPNRIDVNIDNAKVIHELEHSSRFVTAVLPVDSCFPNSTSVLWGKAANKIVGKRMRFFGTRLQAGRGRRVFFMQPAEEPMPDFSLARKQYVTKAHTPVTTKTYADGWVRARSTEGPFSIDMPGRFVDVTKMDAGEPGFMLRATDQYGSTFIAVFERSGPDSAMGGTFDSTISKPDANTTMFKGAEAAITTGRLPGNGGDSITNGLWFRVPGGTYMLGVVATKEHEAEALKMKDRFFNSLRFE